MDDFKAQLFPGKRGLLKRKQWYCRIVSVETGDEVFRSSEGYNNSQDLWNITRRVHPRMTIEWAAS